MMTVVEDRAEKEPDGSRRRLVIRVAVGAVAVVAVAVGSVFVYAKVINDAPSALDEGDLGDALVVVDDDGAFAADATTGDSTTGDSASPTSGTIETSAATGDDFDGDWVATAGSEFGYRVDEVLAGVDATAVGRSNQIDGALTIQGTTATAVSIEVDVATIESDDGLRDGKFRGDIMNTAEFPTASFVLTEPIDFGSIPAGDDAITATATGDLSLRGVTNSVTFEVTARTTDGRIGVLGSIPVVFADYGIDNPSFGPVRTEDEGTVEFVLVFDRA